MSGGHFDYNEWRVRDTIDSVAADKAFERWPRTRQALRALAPVLYQIIREADYDICADTGIHDDMAWDDENIRKLMEAVVQWDSMNELKG